jgi:hypothetical protein
MVAFFFQGDPFFRAQLPPLEDSPGYDLLAYLKGNIIEVLAGKVVALVTALVFMLQGASPYFARLTMAKLFVRHATLTNDLLGCDPIHRG